MDGYDEEGDVDLQWRKERGLDEKLKEESFIVDYLSQKCGLALNYHKY